MRLLLASCVAALAIAANAQDPVTAAAPAWQPSTFATVVATPDAQGLPPAADLLLPVPTNAVALGDPSTGGFRTTGKGPPPPTGKPHRFLIRGAVVEERMPRATPGPNDAFDVEMTEEY